MRGGAQSHLVSTDCGDYVCKWQNNPQHRRVLVNEAISSQLLARLGIATPNWAVVHVDEEFIASNPSASISLKSHNIPVPPGPHFGSRLMPEIPHSACYNVLPNQLIESVINLSDFFKVLVFDCWADNRDGRQAVFWPTIISGKRLRFRAQMIDNGFAFGFDGTDWHMCDRTVGKLYRPLGSQYLSNRAAAHIDDAIAAAQSVQTSTFNSFMDALPREWLADDYGLIRRLGTDLNRRAARLPSLVDDALSLLKETIADPAIPAGAVRLSSNTAAYTHIGFEVVAPGQV